MLLGSLRTFQQLSPFASRKPLTLSLRVPPVGTKHYQKNNTRQRRVEHLFYVSIHIFRDGRKPLSVSKTLKQGKKTTPGRPSTWPVHGLMTLGAKQVALGTTAHSEPKEDNGRITTVPSRDGISPVERLSGRDNVSGVHSLN
jgi:hypothetical protein